MDSLFLLISLQSLLPLAAFSITLPTGYGALLPMLVRYVFILLGGAHEVQLGITAQLEGGSWNNESCCCSFGGSWLRSSMRFLYSAIVFDILNICTMAFNIFWFFVCLSLFTLVCCAHF